MPLLEIGTEGGRLAGVPQRGVHAFKGIPFAAPPVGELRWKPPRPVRPWAGTRPADRFGPAPIQFQPPRTSIMWHSNFADRDALVMSEDCLYLNVWTPEPSPAAALPVLVFLHGGGNRFGHGGMEVHDGAALAGRGVVVVTLNMRLGSLGFLAHPELAAEDELGASGNYGLLDVVAGLRWVRRNIGAFGGDPAKVTLAGNSAGAAILTHLMAAEAGRGLFRTAIGQSSSGAYRAEGPLLSQEEAQRRSVRALGALGSAPLARLRRLSSLAVLVDSPLGIVLDGRLLTEPTENVFDAGRQAPIPLLVGNVTDEGTPYTTQESLRALREHVTSGPYGARLGPLYPVDEEHLRASARAFVAETRFSYPVWRWARTHTATSGAPTWMYRFDHRPPLPADLEVAEPADGGSGYGVFHTSELPYMADNLWSRQWNWSESDRELARVMADSWAAFVATGDPNCAGLPRWATFHAEGSGDVLVFGDPLRRAPVPRLDALRLLDSLPRPL